jgi:precorrin-6B methylase 2
MKTGGVGYHAIRELIRSVQTICTRARITGLEHFPRVGGVLIVSNHVSIADPVVLISASPRPLVFMAKQELYRARFAGRHARAVRVHPALAGDPAPLAHDGRCPGWTPTVIEGGTGAGALTIALLRAVGKEGRVISYELREDFADAARKNVATFFGDAPNWTIKVRDLYGGFDETGVDRMFLDLAEPGRALQMASDALRPGGVLVCYVPTAIQLKDTVEAIQARSDFGEVESFETLLRHWQVKGLSVRPHFRMIAHSAFIIVSRRLVPLPAHPQIETVEALSSDSAESATSDSDHDSDPLLSNESGTEDSDT